MLGNFASVLSADLFQNLFSRGSGLQSECQTVWIKNRPDVLSGLFLVQNGLQMLSTGDIVNNRIFQCLQNAEKKRNTYIKGRLLYRAMILYNCVPFQNGNFS